MHEYTLLVNDHETAISKLRHGLHFINCDLCFENQVGITHIKLLDKHNKSLFELFTEVFPQKMNYRSDYRAMMEDIKDIIRNLSYSFLEKTYMHSRPKASGCTTEPEWWRILDILFVRFIQSIKTIQRQPRHEIHTYEKILPVDKIKKGSFKNNIWFQKNTRYVSHNKGFKLLKGICFTHALSIQKYTTYNTYENRFIAYALKQTIYRLRIFKKDLMKEERAKNYQAIINRMDNYHSTLQSVLNSSPFNEVSDFEKRWYFSTTLTKGAGYRDFFQMFLLLSKGLEILENDIFKIEQKDISRLYEYWCFLRIVEILKDITRSDIHFQDQNIVKIDAGRLKVDLKKGKESEVSFRSGHDEKVSVYFNMNFNTDNKKTYTYNQRPDISLKFNKNGYKKPFWYIFDAKYRFKKEIEKDDYNAPEDAIGQLHRYRDAILHDIIEESTYRAAIKNLGGIILYPYPLKEENFKKNKYFKSIEQVNIGALPFLPGKTELAVEHLSEIIDRKTAEDHFHEVIEFDSSEYREKKKDFSDWITITIIKKHMQKSRIKFLENEQMHYIPYVKNYRTRIYQSKQLLICRSGGNIAWLYDIEGWEILFKDELIKKGISWNLSYSKYIAFYLKKDPKEIKIQQKMIPTNFRYTTKGGLDLYLKDSEKNENAIYLTNLSAARLYLKLSRQNRKYDICWSNNKDDLSEIIFSIDNNKIYSSNKLDPMHFKINNDILCLKDVEKKLGL